MLIAFTPDDDFKLTSTEMIETIPSDWKCKEVFYLNLIRLKSTKVGHGRASWTAAWWDW